MGSLKSWKTYHDYMKKVVSVLITGLILFLLSTLQVSAQPLVMNTPTNIAINPEEPLPANGTVSISTEGAIDSDMNVIPPEGVTVVIENDTVTVTNQTIEIETADEDEDEDTNDNDESDDSNFNDSDESNEVGDEGDEGEEEDNGASGDEDSGDNGDEEENGGGGDGGDGNIGGGLIDFGPVGPID